MEYVWYASYGSNINRERFLCYIQGGTAKCATHTEQGARDDSLPVDEKNILIPRQLYFARKAMKWQGKGVAFVEADRAGEGVAAEKGAEQPTLGWMYLITVEQFEDVVKQENSLPVSDPIDLRLEEAREKGSVTLLEKSWYGRLVFLGYVDDYPVFTFTSPVDLIDDVVGPSEEYLSMIAGGLVENYPLSLDELVDYFAAKPGVSGSWTEHDLREVLEGL